MDDLESLFPGLHGSGYLVTSPADIRYNCVAWAAEDEEHWWWPDEDSYWPEGVAREETIAAFVAAFEKLGFVLVQRSPPRGGLREGGDLRRSGRHSNSCREATPVRPLE